MKNKRVNNILALVALSLVMFIVTLDTTITNIALPTITDYFNTNLTDSNWISTVYVLIMSVFIIPAAKLGDIFGRKKVMLIGLILFGIGSALCGLSRSLPVLIGMRVLQGFGGSIVTPIMIPLSVELFGREKANKAVGIIGAVTAIAAAAGPPIGGLLIRFVNWQSIFFVNVPVVIITFILIILCFTESFDTTISKHIDWIGMLLLSAGLFQLTLILIKGYDWGWDSKSIIWMIVGTIVSLSFFVLVEVKRDEPLVEFGLFREKTFTASSIIYFMCGFTIVCSSLIFNFYLENVRNYSALNASYIIMFMSLTVMISMPLGSKLVDKIGYRPVIFSGMILMAISLFMQTNLKINTNTNMMVIYMVILGFGFGLSCLSIVSAVQFIPQSKAGMASGVVNAFRQLGTCLGIALLVGMMTHNISLAKTEIESEAIISIQKANISQSVKKVMVEDIHESFNNYDNDGNKKNNFKSKITHDVKTALENEKTFPTAENSSLRDLSDGSKTLLNQLEIRSNDGSTTLLGGIDKLSKGINSFEKAITSYTDAVNITIFEMIKNDMNSSNMIRGYEIQLEKLKSQGNLEKNKEQIEMLENIISLYTAGTDPNVKNIKQFEEKLVSKNKLISSGKQLKDNIDKLSGVGVKITEEFGPNGRFTKGMEKINLGINILGEKESVQKIITEIQTNKNSKIVEAFTKTFMIAGIIIAISSVFGLITDKDKK